METKILSFIDQECLKIINDGDVLAFPTETVYGLGIIYDQEKAFTTLCALKERPPEKPFTIMLSKKEDIHLFVDVDENIQRVIDTFMPGEITLLLKAKKGLYHWLTLKEKTVGIRISSNKDVQDLIQRVNKPMLVTSANMSGSAPLLNTDDVYKVFNSKIRGIVKGKVDSCLPSTIVLIIDNEIKLIRQGSIEFNKIKEVYENENCSCL